MVEPVRHRRTKGAATDMLKPKATASHLDSTNRVDFGISAACPVSGQSRKCGRRFSLRTGRRPRGTRDTMGYSAMGRGAEFRELPCGTAITTARRHILLLIPCIKLVDLVKNSLTDFHEVLSPPPGPERLQVPEAPLRYSAGVQLTYRRKTLFRWLWSAKPLRSAISLSARLSRRRCRHACSTFCF